MKKNRVKSSIKYLDYLIDEGDHFYVCVEFAEYNASPLLNRFGLPKDFKNGEKFIAKPVSGKARENIQGKWIRKVPEAKTTITRHIKYIRKDGVRVEFDRDFHVWEKVLQLQPKFEFEFFEREDGVKFVISPKLTFLKTDKEDLKNTFVINLFTQIFKIFEILDKDYKYPIPPEKRFDFNILPPGTVTDDLKIKIEASTHKFLDGNETEVKDFKERLDYIDEFEPEFLGAGNDGFAGYLVFGFNGHNKVLVESIRRGNATYFFPRDNYINLIKLDKQAIINGKLYVDRVVHDPENEHSSWKKAISKIIENTN
ncbi:hypothetical protein IFO69_04960 [Echinicola sp. CAU 1574]|uniref:Uncharacterized protein n=1 Tax=Echinicola arenosa TaxID=2774144 RepID=A0ABR9AJK9_9BACT|nr:hypothetical protein [Echinicola arenosa]MBD8488090.1 hypothetical protein [Echinicola arenosa]